MDEKKRRELVLQKDKVTENLRELFFRISAEIRHSDSKDALKDESKIEIYIKALIRNTDILMEDELLHDDIKEEKILLQTLLQAVKNSERHIDNFKILDIMESLFKKIQSVQTHEERLIGMKKRKVDTLPEENLRSRKGGFVRVGFLDNLFHKKH